MDATRKAVLAGAVGGLTPLVINLVAIDASALGTATAGEVVGYMIRGAAFMFLGAIVVLMQGESNVKKAVQMGLVAPAILSQFLNAQHIGPPPAEASMPPGMSLIERVAPPAYASETTRPANTPRQGGSSERERRDGPQESKGVLQEVWRGVKGDFHRR